MIFNHQYDVWMCLKMEDGPQHCNFDGNDMMMLMMIMMMTVMDLMMAMTTMVDVLTMDTFMLLMKRAHTRSKEEQVHRYGLSSHVSCWVGTLWTCEIMRQRMS